MKDRKVAVSHRSRLMGLDVGTRKIGIAITDPLRLYARPLTTLRRSELDEDRDQLLGLIREYEVGKVIIGLPRHLDGTESSTTDCIRPLTGRLRQAQVPVEWQDERLSTRLAEEWRSRAKLPMKDRSRLRDQYAAAIILQWYLEEQE